MRQVDNMTALTIIGAVLLLILFLLLCHVKIRIRFADDFTVKLSYLFLRFTLLPAKADDVKKKKPKKSKHKKTKKSGENVKKEIKEKSDKKGFAEVFNEYKEMLLPILKKLGKFTHKIKVNPLKIKIVLAGDDAADLAVNYGKLCAVFYPTLAYLCEQLRVGRKNIYLGVDYASTDMTLEIIADVKIRVISALGFAAGSLAELVKAKVKSMMKNNAQKQINAAIERNNNSNERNAVK